MWTVALRRRHRDGARACGRVPAAGHQGGRTAARDSHPPPEQQHELHRVQEEPCREDKQESFPRSFAPSCLSLPTLWHLCRWIDSMDANPGDPDKPGHGGPVNRIVGGCGRDTILASTSSLVPLAPSRPGVLASTARAQRPPRHTSLFILLLPVFCLLLSQVLMDLQLLSETRSTSAEKKATGGACPPPSLLRRLLAGPGHPAW